MNDLGARGNVIHSTKQQTQFMGITPEKQHELRIRTIRERNVGVLQILLSLMPIQERVEAEHTFKEAINHGSLYIIKILLSHVREVGAVNMNHMYPALFRHAAASRCDGPRDIAQLFIDDGASGADVAKALIESVQDSLQDSTKFLLELGALQHVCRFGNNPTLLHQAAERSNRAMVHELLKHGADIEATDGHGDTPLVLAVRATVRWPSVCECGAIEELLSHGANTEPVVDEVGRTLLGVAVLSGIYPVVELLLSHGANTEAVDQEGRTPLSLAVQHGIYPIVELLLSHGANTEAVDREGRTPLSLAVLTWGPVKMVESLLAHGANTEAVDREGRTPLSLAVQHGIYPVVELLLSHGANTEAVDQEGRTPLSLAVQHGIYPVVELLLSHGANTEAVDQEGRTPLSIAVLTLLSHTILTWGPVKMVESLLAHGANVETADNEGRTPLSLAASNKYEYGDKRGVLGTLLSHGADISSRCHRNKRPVEWVSQVGSAWKLDRVRKALMDEDGAKGIMTPANKQQGVMGGP
ncbi:ankyrin repeat-containing domain protein [Immersiella caudata]|uniref:Ankyrin repeat-containing domain protein n=1 Tax=Immersiella caudata TaxID=314043 RepID=A0AA40BTR6_9PEZI|nr:ankyrin repeat-containing domain protein [Immersiella caudata]